MPCNSSYMEPTHEERNKREVCEHLVYVSNKYMVDIPFDSEITAGADNIYGASCLTLDFLVSTLCDLLGRLDQSLIYEDHSKYGLKLALWWTEHQEADRERIAKEKQEAEDAAAVKSGLAKLTLAERKALGLDDN